MTTKFEQSRLKDQEMRQQLSKDLRREHFAFGFDQLPKQSKYSETMQAHRLDDFSETRQEMEKLKKDLRREHYILGTDDPKSLFQTSASNAFKAYNNPERSKLSVETKNDLRSCHFILGNENKPTQSDYKINYDKKEIDSEVYKDRKDQVVKLRQHHQVFTDKNNYFSTLYNETTNKQYDKDYLHQGKSKKEILDQIVELRKTNLVIGSQDPNFNSEAMVEFSDKGYARNDLLDIDLKRTNYILGTDKNQYNTTVRDTFKGEFQPPDKGKTEELMKDLRKEHYDLGHDPSNYVSENSRTFVEHSKEALLDKPDLSELYRSHFSVGGHSMNIPTDKRYLSDYKQTYQQRDRITNESTRNDRTDRSSNIVFGSDVNNEQFISEQANTLKDFSKVNNKGVFNKELAKDLRGTHYVFGTDKQNFVSTTKETFTDKSKISQTAQLEEELKKDLRRNHFEYGTSQNEYVPMQKDIGKYQGPPSKLNPQLAKQLRSHHFVHGISGPDYLTTYKKHHIDFTKD